MTDEVSGNIVAELSKRGEIGGFRAERIQSVIEGIGNKVEDSLKDSRNMAGKL